jgi:transmembrane sensor
MPLTRLYYLLERRFQGSMTSAEETELARMLDENGIDLIIETMIPQIKREFGQPLPIDPIIEASTYKKIMAVDKPMHQSSALIRPVSKLRGWSWAAAILILMGGVIYWGSQQLVSHPAGITKDTGGDIQPGGQKAMLTLPGGQKIILDSARGNILQQKNLKLFNEDGQLHYEGIANAVEMHTLSTPKGGQYQVTLPDDTKVWLNAASSISYPTAFPGKERNVTISGEAYFEVAQNPGHPFHVKTNGIEVDVLGTHFNINAYTNEGTPTATLLEGSIKVRKALHDDPQQEQVILRPGQQAQVNKIITVENVDADVVLAWKNGLFNFTGSDLPTVMRQLERWYDIEVKFKGTIPSFKFKGKMDRGVTLSEMLEMLTKMGLSTQLEGRTLTIMPSIKQGH